MDQDVERRIRDRAHSIWEEEGRPTGRDVDHWLRAAQEIAAEEHGTTEGGNAVTAAAGEEKPKKARAPRAAAKGDKGAAAEKAEKSEKGGKAATTEGKGAKSAAAEKTAEPAPKAKRASKKAG